MQQNIAPLAGIDLPEGLRIDSVEKNVLGETNDVFFCTGLFEGRPVSAYIKVNKNPRLSLFNEQAVLHRLETSGIPVPAVLWYDDRKNRVLIVEAIEGEIIWNFIDPRRGPYDRDRALSYLRACGACLGAIHNLDIDWLPQKRPRLYGLIGEEQIDDERFRRVVSWLENNRPAPADVFVHGDFNTASVLFRNDAISGVIDWEFAGRGWREYDLAWTLRARLNFLNTPAERDAILEGYSQRSTYDEDALRWCEALNYLHFAYWCRETEPTYTSFAIEQALRLAGIP